MWKKLKEKLLGGSKVEDAPAHSAPTAGFTAPRPDLASQEPTWIEAADNDFGVRLLDVRPVTLGTLSTSGDPRMAQNAVSYGGEDGRSFAAQAPASKRVVEAALRFRAPDGVRDGALFIPAEMEDKWAVFVQGGALLLVRSWRREVLLRAPMTADGSDVVLGPLEGFVANEDEGEAYTRRAVDFIVRTHGLEQNWPAPLLGDEASPRAMALECMSVFGRNALVASPEEPTREVPARPLRVMTRLHIATIRGDVAAARQALAEGLPVGLRDRFGRSAVHYVRAPGEMLDCLRDAGADLDEAADDGTTLLMYATQARSLGLVERVLALGVAADRGDRRGFTALHRAAEMGEVDIARALVARGADPDRSAEGGHTPRSLATKRGESAVLALLPAKG